MPKTAHRKSQRIILPNGMWVLIYENGDMKIAGYDRDLSVTEVLNRGGSTAGAHVFLRVKNRIDEPKATQPRDADLVTMPRAVQRALTWLKE